MNTGKKRKKNWLYFLVVPFIVVLIVILLVVSLFVTAFFCEPIRVILPTKTVEEFLLYDHIEYNDMDYYYYDSSKKPDGITPDFDNEVKVIVANSNCRPYGENTFLAYLCKNDNDHTYIYYGSCYFVNDKSLAADHWQ